MLDFLLTGMVQWTVWSVIGYLLVATQLTILGVTLYLHRHQAHRALDLHPAVSHFFRFWLWLTTGMNTREWVAVHRKHHARVETPEDPHSPVIHGIGKLLTQGTELYRAAAGDPGTVERYGFGTPDDWLERRVYSRHSLLGIGALLGIDVALFGVLGLTVWAVQMMWIPFFAAGVINGVGHYWGYRNYEVPDASRNIVPWGLFIGGEELHNNHHTHPSSARFSDKWWELDLGWGVIRLLSALGLARVKKLPPRTVQVPGKTGPDLETMRAIVTARFQVMARYYRDVVRQVLREEGRLADATCRPLLRRARRLLRREEGRLDGSARKELEAVLTRSPALATVYDFRQRLRALWSQTASSQEQLVKSVQDWCRQAEASGVRALQEFARSLAGYALRPA